MVDDNTDNERDLAEVERVWGMVRTMVLDGRLKEADILRVLNNALLSTRSIQELLSCASLQLSNLKGWSEMFSWGLSEHDFMQLPPPPLPRHGNDPLVTTLMFGDEDVQLTVAEWILAINSRDWTFRMVEEIKLESHALYSIDERRNGANVPVHRKGLYWMEIDILANWDVDIGISPEQCQSEKSAGAEMFCLAAQHPDLIKRMGVKGVPQFWVPGLAARTERHPNGDGALYFGWREPDNVFTVDVRSRRDRRPYYSNPVIMREVPATD
jgi:hypothetical protein